jgi:hypothetical protein
MDLMRLARLTTLTIVFTLTVGTAYVLAQGLPQTPNASDKAAQGGLTAGASLQREGGSALEPYLITWLLPVFGIVMFASSVIVDKRLRNSPSTKPVTIATRSSTRP